MKLYKNFFVYIINIIQTTVHKYWIVYYSLKLCSKIILRAFFHDLSKYNPKECFALYSQCKLKDLKFGSDEYVKNLNCVKSCLDHHYKRNRHHPEYHYGGYNAMSGLDRIEMIIDWIAACRRTENGNIYNSIMTNQERYNYSKEDVVWLFKLAREIHGKHS
jgi:hypothetical protein